MDFSLEVTVCRSFVQNVSSSIGSIVFKIGGELDIDTQSLNKMIYCITFGVLIPYFVFMLKRLA